MSGHQMSDDETSTGNEDDVDVKRVVICEVKEQVFLYDPTHPDHTKCNLYQKAWEEIGRATGMSAEGKQHSLRRGNAYRIVKTIMWSRILDKCHFN